MKDIEGAPITQELLQKIIDDYIEYYVGTYLKYGCMLVNAYGRPRLYDDEREEQYGKSRN
jgi:hypothetical protein